MTGWNGAEGWTPSQVQTDAVPVVKPRRNRKSAKAAGSSYEGSMAKYFADTLGEDRIERRRQGGADDRGDIGGIKTIRGGRVVVECKNYSSDRIQITGWLAEAERERGNDDAFIGVVAVKVRGTAVPAEQLICMTAETFARLLLGGPEDVRDTVDHDPSQCGMDCLTHGISAENARESEFFRKQGLR